jgi:hypothetical protein
MEIGQVPNWGCRAQERNASRLKMQMIKNYFLNRFYALQILLRIVTYFIKKIDLFSIYHVKHCNDS